MSRHSVLKRIKSLDPVKDHLEIVQFTHMWDFPKDTEVAPQLAFLKTFAIPSIGNLLEGTGEFEKRPQKRYDDTDLILSEILEYGYDSERGKRAIKTLNHIHSRFNITNDDYLYVLTTFVMEPYRWIQQFGFRKLTEHEKIAAHQFWVQVGHRMGIQNIPNSFSELEQLNSEIERTRFGFSEGGRQVTNHTVNLLLGWYLPKFLWSMGRPFVYAALDDHLVATLQLNPPAWWVKRITRGVLRARASIKKILPGRNRPFYRTTRTNNTTYPKGYEIEKLGPGKDTKIEERWLKKHRTDQI